MTLSPDEIKAFQTSILEHYYEHNRSMPWRESFDPYEILVSEFMLQQTQVSRVLPKYLEWLEKFLDWKTSPKPSCGCFNRLVRFRL